MAKFFDFIGIRGKTLEQKARTFANKGKNDSTWALSNILKFIYFQRERVDKKQISEVVAYYVAHEKLKGTWGKNKTVSKLRRCYIKDPKQRDIILKKLGRYIERE